MSVNGKISAIAGAALAGLLFSGGAAAESEAVDLTPYQTPLPEYGLVDGPDGRYLTRQSGPWGAGAGQQIFFYPAAGGAATSPSFADARDDNADFYFSRAQNLGCFISDRPAGDLGPGDNIWCVQWNGDAWGEPELLPAPVNSAASEFSPVIRPDGAVYFASDRDGGEGLGDLYKATKMGGGWAVENLGRNVNSPGGEWNLELSPDGETMIFEASHRDANITVPGDLYVSQRRDSGWSPAVPLSKVNTAGSDLMARYLADGGLTIATSSGEDADLRVIAPDELEVRAPVLAAVSRSAGEVVLLDPQTLETLARLEVGAGPHDIAVSEDGRLAATPLHGVFPAPHEEPITPDQLQWRSEKSEGFRMLDLHKEEVKALYPHADCLRPHGAAISAQGRRLWITCETEGRIDEINPATGEIIRTFDIGEGVHKVMHLPKRNMLAASNPARGETALIDLEDGAVAVVETGRGAEALAADKDQTGVFVANSFDRTICRVDIETKTVSACAPSGGNFPIAVAVDEAGGRVWVANNASASLTAVDFAAGEVKQTIALPSRPLGLAFDAVNRRLYVGLPRLNAVVMIDAETGETLAKTDDVMEVDDLDLTPAAAFGFAPDT